jgi:hypothetical protein
MIQTPGQFRRHETTRAQGPTYERQRDLPRLLRLWPEEVRRLEAGDQDWLVLKLAKMLRTERQLGLARHWSYELARHAALLRAWRAEKEVQEVRRRKAIRLPAATGRRD